MRSSRAERSSLLVAALGAAVAALIVLAPAGASSASPPGIGPFVNQGGELLRSDEIGAGEFGSDVALSSDGNTALVGAPGDAGGVGAAWVFTRTGASWTESAKIGGDREGGTDLFGRSVALSSDGNTALIGGDGAAWVYARAGAIWVRRAKLVGSEQLGPARFGYAVALSADGSTALVGGPSDHPYFYGGFEGAGAVWAFVRTGGTWLQQGPKIFGGGSGDLGFSVGLSGDGKTALAGAPGLEGSVSVLAREDSMWKHVQTLRGAGEEGDGGFGSSVALSSDSSTAIVGAPVDHRVDSGVGLGGRGPGAAWLFARGGPGFVQQGAKLSLGFGTAFAEHFGSGVSLSADGGTALVALGRYGVQGSAYVFTRAGSVWSTSGEPIPIVPRSSGRLSERTVALSDDASTVLVGEALDNAGAGSVAAYVRGPLIAPAAALAPPVISRVRQSRSVWRAGRAPAHASARRSQSGVGTVFTFSLNEAASVSFAFAQRVPGRVVGRKCAPGTSRDRRAERCVVSLRRGVLVFAAHSGANRVAFDGRVTRTRTLAPGSYAVTISAVNAAGARSRSRTLTFAILADLGRR